MRSDLPNEKYRLEQYLSNIQREIDSVALYHTLSDSESKPEIAEVYRRLAAVEDAHAEFWKERLTKLGHELPNLSVGWRTRSLMWLARRFGPDFVLPVVSSREQADVGHYSAQSEAITGGLHAAERSHARIIGSVAASVPNMSVGPLANALRAAVLGANDGLASNLSLVMGVAGAHLTSRAILVTGVSGVIAGACAMAMGEWLSVKTSRESHHTNIDVEARELAEISEEERDQLALIYSAKGLKEDEARRLVRQPTANLAGAPNAVAGGRLGSRSNEFAGYAWTAAMSSFLLFGTGASIPVLPFILLSGSSAVLASIVISSVVLFLIGAGVTLFTGRSVFLSGIRQLLVGLAAAGVTYALGHAIGASITP